MPRFAPLAARVALLLLAGPLLAGCGGAAADAKGFEPPNGGSVGDAAASAAASASAAPDDAGFMHVGKVALGGAAPPAEVTVAAATASASAPPPPPPGGGKLPELKSGAHFAREVNKPDPSLEDEAHGKGEAGNDGGAGQRAGGALHAAVVDSGGNLSEAEVRSTIVQQSGSFRACYDIGAQAVASFSGTVTLRVSIGPSGTVANVDIVASTTKIAQVDSCVTQAVRRIQFPAKGNGAVVSFPIEFGK